ncbi:hypothetical protein MXD63_17655 [Frankia sp. Cpl3]|nr:hypothetical protein [Frankia sp. Cpl3]
MTSPGLGRESITSLLQELNDELGRRGAKADLFSSSAPPSPSSSSTT